MHFSPLLVVASAMFLSSQASASPLLIRQDATNMTSEVTDPHLAPDFPANFTGPIADGGVAWADAFSKAKSLVDQMTLEEKVNITTGFPGPCAGNTGAVERLNIGSLCFQDGPAGVRPADLVSTFPAGVTVTATWNRELFYQRALQMAEEFKGKGIHTALAPVTGGPIGRSPLGGRNWEGTAPDVFLSSVASKQSVKGFVDAKVVPTAKHFLAYEQDSWRRLNQEKDAEGNLTALYQQIDSHLNDRTTRELYLPSFAEAVRAGAGSVMSSYNSVNGTHAGSNSHLLNDLLKGDGGLGFQGYVMSDWGGTWDTTQDALAGMDATMPGSGYDGDFGSYFGQELVDAVNSGAVPEARVADMAIRILTPYYALGQDEGYPEVSFDYHSVTAAGNQHVDVRGEHWKVIKQFGEEASTLLKNSNSSSTGLPIANKTRIGVFGNSAGPLKQGLTGCGDFLNCFEDPDDADGFPGPRTPSPQLSGVNYIGGGSGSVNSAGVVSPLEAISERFRRSNTTVDSALNYSNETATYTKAVAAKTDTAIVFVSAFQTEGWDREDIKLYNNEDQLILDVAAECSDTIVVIHSGQTVDMEAWIEHPNVTAVVFQYYAGDEVGAAAASVLFGDAEPSGRLPFTIAKSLEDYPGGAKSVIKDDVFEPVATFDEGVFIDYKWFDAKNITPRFPFGFGLSRTSFGYADAAATLAHEADAGFVQLTKEPFAGEGGLYDQVATVSVTVTNEGEVEGTEVAQLYMTYPSSITDRPASNLAGFSKDRLAAGQSTTVTFALRNKDLALWDVERQTYFVPGGEFTFKVGRDSRDLRVETRLEIVSAN